MNPRPVVLLGLSHLRWTPASDAQRALVARRHREEIRSALPDSTALLDWLAHARPPTLPPIGERLAAGSHGGSEQPLLYEPTGSASCRWSVACIERFGTLQAFVIVDHVASALLLVRAALSEVPLCYLRVGQQVAVAFTAEALAREFPSQVHVDLGRVADALVDFLQWIDLQSTFYREIRKLPSGEWIVFEGAKVRGGCSWKPAPAPPRASLQADADFESALLEVLSRAVTARCSRADGPVGSMLSGGLDSSSVVAIAGRLRADAGGSLPVLSLMRSGDPGCVESQAIHDAMHIRGVEAHLLDLTRLGEDAQTLEQSLWEVDEPWDVNSSLFRWVYMRAERLRLSVVLDGVDGDSLFLEGDLIPRQLRRLQFLRAWRNLAGGERFWGTGEPAWSHLIAACRMAFGVGLGGFVRRLVSQRQSTSGAPNRFDALLREYPIDPAFAKRVDLAARAARYDAESARHEAFDVRGPELGMERYFRAAAPHGVVPAHPFMDPDLVGFCLALPREQCLVDGWPKSVLRRAMRGLLPDAVRWRVGKQHLGFELTRAVVASNPIPLEKRLRRLRGTLDGIVQQSVLDHHCAAFVRSDQDLLQRIELLGLAEWLHRRGHLL